MTMSNTNLVLMLYVYLTWPVVLSKLPQINKECLNDRNGICVNIWNCPYYADLMHRTSHPRPLPVIRNIRKNLCGFVNKDTPEVCCRNPLMPSNQVDNNSTHRPSHKQNPSSNNWKVNLKYHRNYRLLSGDTCGFVSSGSRITSGSSTQPGEFPWMALIAYSREDEFPEFRCGGTVISDRYVLTAAHCIDNSTILGIRLGEYNILSDRDCDKSGYRCNPPVQDLLINKIIVHPKYNPTSYANDIALIRLATPANFTSVNVRPICLPITKQLIDYDLSNGRSPKAIVAGWGVTEKGDKSATLLKVTIPVVDQSQCVDLYSDFKPITKDQICAGGYRGRDSCAGDSGGPLKLLAPWQPHSIRFVQFGIVSYGPRYCGMDGRPGIYTRISSYVQWILDSLESSSSSF